MGERRGGNRHALAHVNWYIFPRITNVSFVQQHVMKGFKKSLLWITCFQFVSMVRTEQGIEDGQVQCRTLMRKKEPAGMAKVARDYTNRIACQCLMYDWIPLWDSRLPKC